MGSGVWMIDLFTEGVFASSQILWVGFVESVGQIRCLVSDIWMFNLKVEVTWAFKVGTLCWKLGILILNGCLGV